jgi:hypothetical protein
MEFVEGDTLENSRIGSLPSLIPLTAGSNICFRSHLA